MATRDYSVVEYYAEHDGYRCGYCKSTDSNSSHGMWAHSLSVDDYQSLIDRGWRRSGRYCYKPTMHITCCPMYTIKCAALDFKLTKSQKKVLKKINRFLVVGEKKCTDQIMESSANTNAATSVVESEGTSFPEVHPSAVGREHSENATVVNPSLLEIGLDSLNKLSSLTGEVELPAEDATPSKTQKLCRQGEGADRSRPLCKKAKAIRWERKQQKLGLRSQDLDKGKSNAVREKSLEEFIKEGFPESPIHRLEVRLVQSHPSFLEASAGQELAVYRKYQMAVHGDPADKCTESQYSRFLVASPLKCPLVEVGSGAFSSSLPESRELFAKYQMAVHGDKPEECNAQAFYEFLVDSPLEIEAVQDASDSTVRYGSFHQQYWLDGRLIAVGVIDILPTCVSSVYFYYDPDLGHLSLGTYASLQEIALTRSLHCRAPNLRYYYMGFYIHSCPKMRYKAAYCPSFLLCPETYTWNAIASCLPKLDANKYSRLDDDPLATDSDAVVNVNQVLVLWNQRPMLYKSYKTGNRNAEDSEEVIQYATLVGMKCARRILLYRS